jgi:hypothetical protein
VQVKRKKERKQRGKKRGKKEKKREGKRGKEKRERVGKRWKERTYVAPASHSRDWDSIKHSNESNLCRFSACKSLKKISLSPFSAIPPYLLDVKRECLKEKGEREKQR